MATRVLIERDPGIDNSVYQFMREPWPAKWIAASATIAPGAWAFRRQVTCDAPQRVRMHVSADQRYVLYLDGKLIGRGSERSDLRHWMYESYDVDLSAGAHTLVAFVWWLDPSSPTPCPWAQITHRPGFLVMAEGDAGDLLNTGVAAWDVRPLDGVKFEWVSPANNFFAIGSRIVVDGARYPWGVELGQGNAWQPAVVLHQAAIASLVWESTASWLLRPAMLPAMKDEPFGDAVARCVDAPGSADTSAFAVRLDGPQKHEVATWNDFLASNKPLTIPPNTRRRAIVDLKRYACAYTRLNVSGGRGATMRVRWAESLFEYVPARDKSPKDVRNKNNRDDIAGRIFLGYGDALTTDGGTNRVLDPLWWNAGRYVEVYVETSAEPVTLQSFEIRETGYPYEFQSTFDASDARLAKVTPLALHTLRMCSHETSMDCPHYEQLNYVGDTRLQSLVALSTSTDDRLARKVLQLFDWSRTSDNWTSSRYPTSMLQTIPPFCMWWVCMANDYALYRGDRALLATLMPGVRSIVERWRQQVNDKGLVVTPDGWNFVDWVKQWRNGVPSPQPGTVCGVLQWQLIYTLMKAAQLEEMLNEPLLAQRHRQTAAAMAASAERAFFDEGRGLLADDVGRTHFSEHVQALAIISGQLSANLRDRVAAGLLEPKDDLARTSIYFSHYTFEALRELGRTDAIIDRMQLWFDHPSMGLSTLIESPEPARSDCHAWGAHPVYHYYASVLGIRPAALGFTKVSIRPQLGPLEWARGDMVHPAGRVRVDLKQADGRLTGTVALPAGVTGEIVANGRSVALTGGVTTQVE